MKKTVFVATIVSILTVLAVGCSKPEDPGRTVTEADTKQAEIERIKNDPNMPEQAKKAAIEGMEKGEKAAKARVNP
jgi:outer membrane murein-binding lipoprotein Lpp